MAMSRGWLAVAVLVAGLLIGLAGWLLTSPHQPLAKLPAAERSGLYERTMHNLASLCGGQRASELKDFCREQADTAVALPECDDRCRALAEPHRPRPTR